MKLVKIENIKDLRIKATADYEERKKQDPLMPKFLRAT